MICRGFELKAVVFYHHFWRPRTIPHPAHHIPSHILLILRSHMYCCINRRLHRNEGWAIWSTEVTNEKYWFGCPWRLEEGGVSTRCGDEVAQLQLAYQRHKQHSATTHSLLKEHGTQQDKASRILFHIVKISLAKLHWSCRWGYVYSWLKALLMLYLEIPHTDWSTCYDYLILDCASNTKSKCAVLPVHTLGRIEARMRWGD